MNNFQERQKVFSELAKRIDLNVSLADAALDEIVTLRARLLENEGKVCDDCDGSGWQENAVEGRYPCTCMTEAEPYQLLAARAQKMQEALKKWRYVNDSFEWCCGVCGAANGNHRSACILATPENFNKP